MQKMENHQARTDCLPVSRISPVSKTNIFGIAVLLLCNTVSWGYFLFYDQNADEGTVTIFTISYDIEKPFLNDYLVSNQANQ